MQEKESKSYEHIAHILLAIAVTAMIAFGLGCYTGSTMERKHEQAFYDQYIKPVAETENELMQNLGQKLKSCQENLAGYQKVTMTSNAAQYDSIQVAIKAKFADFEARQEELAKAKEALAEAKKKAKK